MIVRVIALVSAVLLLAAAAPPHQGGLGLGADYCYDKQLNKMKRVT